MRRRIVPLMVASAIGAPALTGAVVFAPAAAAAPPRLTVSRAADGSVHFIGTAAGAPVPRPAGLSSQASPETVARAHLARYGSLFGISDQARELRLHRLLHGAGHQSVVRFQQVEAGLPVLAGELSVALGSAGDLLSINGETAPSVAPVSFAVAPAAAARTAIASTARANGVAPAALTASVPERWLYDAALVGPDRQTTARAVWRFEVRATDDSPVRQLVLVDAATGAIALSFNQVAAAKERHVCDLGNVPQPSGDNSCRGTYLRSEGQPPVALTDANDAYDYTGATYDFYFDRFGRDSVDDAGMPLISAVRYCPDSTHCPYENAFWDGDQMTYGAGFASADDVVAHELTHGVTEHTNGLLYYYQSGAIDESMSDVFGEFVDLTDGVGNDADSVRWQIGEDLPAGWKGVNNPDPVVRDMADPPRHGQPDTTSSPLWNSDWNDAGGVHTNSGVGNKAAYLMTDGGTFNGTTVAGLGIDRTAAIYYRTQQLLTSGADYHDLYNLLQQSCIDLLGTINGYCDQVKNALDAVQMNADPAKDPRVPATPPACQGSSIFWDNFNTTLAKWTRSGPWQLDGSYENTSTSGTALYVPDVDAAANFTATTSQGFVVPTGRSTYFRFDHAESFDWVGPGSGRPAEYYDGGLVEISTDNGAHWVALPIVSNGYPHVLASPLSRAAFSGDSTDWYTSQATLTPYAGRSVKLRFRVVTDGVAAASSAYGWWIDNANLYSCPNRQAADFTGNGRANLAIFRPSNGYYYVKDAFLAGPQSFSWPVPADYNGDGKSEPATYDVAGFWAIAGQPWVQFGQQGDIPVPADYDGDGRTDIAVRRDATWYIRGRAPVTYGLSSDYAVPADYDGDGKADIAVFRDGEWYVRGITAMRYGAYGDRPTPADYNGDGKADLAVFRPSTGTWYARGILAVRYGVSPDVPASADYNGDHKADLAVWRPSTGYWYVRGILTTRWGVPGDKPIRNYWY